MINLFFTIASILIFTKLIFILSDISINRDFPWILETGKYILNNFNIPKTDIFSWTLPDKEFIVYQWLFEVIIAWFNKTINLYNTIKLYLILVIFSYILIPFSIHKSKQIPASISLLFCALGCLLACINLSLRPMIATSLFLLLQYIILEKNSLNKKSIISLILMYILWGNIHTGIVLGLLSLLINIISNIIQKKQLLVKQISIQFIICFGVSLINPYGYKIYSYLFNLSNQKYLNTIIGELQSLNFHDFIPKLFLFSFIIFLLIPKKYYTLNTWLHILIFSVLTFIVGRFIVWSALYFSLGIPIALHNYLCEIEYEKYRKLFNIKYNTLIYYISLFVLIISCFIIKPNIKGECFDFTKSIEFYTQIVLNKQNVKLLNDELIGSCLILENGNKNKVFIDSRFDFYSGNFIRDWHYNFIESNGLKSFLNKWQPDYIFISKHTRASKNIKYVSEYKLIHEDTHAIIYKKV